MKLRNAYAALLALTVLCIPMLSGAQNVDSPEKNKSAQKVERSTILKTAERIRGEERRQLSVRRNMGSAVRRIDWLLNDLESNTLLEQGSGDVVSQMSASLVKVNTENVPDAAGHLKKARTEINDAYPHLNRAGEEIEIIITELDRVLKETGSSLILDLLIARIRAIIKTEEFLRGETAEWGKELLVKPGVAEIDKGRVAAAQQAVTARLAEFTAQLNKALESTYEWELRSRLRKAQNAMKASKPDSLLRNATTSILEKKAIDAVGHQDNGLVALREIEEILSAAEEEDVASADVADSSQQYGTEMDSQAMDGMDSSGMDAMGMDGAGMDGMGMDGAGMDGAGMEGAGMEGAGMEGAGMEGAGMEGAGMEGAGMGMGMGMGMMPGMGMGMMPGMGGKWAPGPPGDPPDDMPIDSGGFSSTEASGEKAQRTQTTINALERRQRSAAIQEYVQKISPEFRKQVAEYYEVIAE